jgi:hypothetical protein
VPCRAFANGVAGIDDQFRFHLGSTLAHRSHQK